jgi:hypothetical protein
VISTDGTGAIPFRGTSYLATRLTIGELLGHKASDVAAKHYIGDVLGARAPLIARLALPAWIQIRGTLIEVPGEPVPAEHPEKPTTWASLPAGNSQSWLAVRAGNLFICSGDECAMSNASAATSFRFSSAPMTVSVEGVALRPDGLALVGGINGNPLLQQLVSCKH